MKRGRGSQDPFPRVRIPHLVPAGGKVAEGDTAVPSEPTTSVCGELDTQ